MDTAGHAGAPANAGLGAWMEWRARCALDRCSRETQSALRSFASQRFRTMVDRYRHRTGAGDALSRSAGISREEAWHLFETHLLVPSETRSKRYKDWLFARVGVSADDAFDVVQGGATLLMRDVVRGYLRSEVIAYGTVSLDERAADADGHPVTYADLLPAGCDTIEEAALHEYTRLATRHADELLAAASHEERMVLLARSLGVSLNSQTAQRLAGCGKSSLYNVYRRFVEALASRLRSLYADEDVASVMMLTRLTLSHIKERLVAWAAEQESGPGLFGDGEMQDVGTETA